MFMFCKLCKQCFAVLEKATAVLSSSYCVLATDDNVQLLLMSRVR